MENSRSMKKANEVKYPLIPSEITEANWRFWSFILLALVAIYLMYTYRVPVVQGLTDPFYSPTFLVLPLVAGFRVTCYAYRKDYHRHLFRHPNACNTDIREESSGRKYTGETRLFRIENYHRYFWYAAVAILPFFYYDIYLAMTYKAGMFTFSLGALLLVLNTAWVTIYTFSCHFFRHAVGGNIDCYSCPVNKKSVRRGFFNKQSAINRHHEAFAWISLASFFLVDLFVRGVAYGLSINPMLITFRW